MDIKEAFAITEIFKEAKPSSLTRLASCSSLKKTSKGEHLFHDKDDVINIYVVIEGMAALYKYNGIGEKKVIFVYGKGNALNEVILNDMPSSINCEILKEGLVLIIPKKELLLIMEQDFKLTKAIMDSMAIKIRRLYRQIKNTSHSIRGDKKIAAKLWKLSMDYGIPCKDGVKIDLNLTITYLADIIGSKRETTSRQVKILNDKGLIVFKNNHFYIPNQEKLREYFKIP